MTILNFPDSKVSISIGELTNHLYSYSIYLKLNNIESDRDYLDVRLRVFKGKSYLNVGDAQYDIDSRGYCSSGTLILGSPKEACRQLAKELIVNLQNSITQ